MIVFTALALKPVASCSLSNVKMYLFIIVCRLNEPYYGWCLLGTVTEW